MRVIGDAPDVRVLLLTSAYNEARFAGRLVSGVAGQSRRPDRWLIVDDGSTDGTYDALQHHVKDLEWVTLVRRDLALGAVPDRLADAAGSRALNWGLSRVQLAEFTHVGKLDADVELPPHFVEHLLAGFDRDPSLGMTAGVLTELSLGRWRRLRQPISHPPAPARIYTRECFEACGGFRERLAWDTIDEVYARMRGFATRGDMEVRVRHMRRLGTADGRLRGRARHGRCAWIVHHPPLWVLLRSVKVAVTFKPRGVAGLAFLGGYLGAALRSVPQVDDPEFRRFVRRELRLRMLTALVVSRRTRGVRRVSAPAQPVPSRDELNVLGVRVHMVEREEALQRIEGFHASSDPSFVAYVNPHTVNITMSDSCYRTTLEQASLRIADGFGIRCAALRAGVRVPTILNGSDFNAAVLERCAVRGWPVYLLGGRPGIADAAAARLSKGIPGLRVVGTAHGYYAEAEQADVARAVRDSGASVLLVALGQPQQERWLERHLEATGAHVGVAVGGFFDFAAGAIRRAPAWMNRTGLEWTFRLAMEPRRLARRYVVGNPLFLWRLASTRPR
jgi:exopolysaccharide biosynthesis WecB/TagA/CpsF family protein